MTPKPHDRRATDVLAAGQYAVTEVVDPYASNEKIIVIRQLRGDPLARLHANRQIDEAQFHAGRAYQHHWETAESGARAIDPTKEAVDGGQLPEVLTEGRRKSAIRLNEATLKLGQGISEIVRDLLIGGLSIGEIAAKRGLKGQYQQKLIGSKFRNGLDILAKLWGYSNGERPASKGDDRANCSAL